MNLLSRARPLRLGAAVLALLLTGACSTLLPKAPPQPSFYSFDGALADAPPMQLAGLPQPAPTLIVNPLQAAAGFDSQHIIFQHRAHQLEYFARSEWVDTPARMMAPLVVAAVHRSGAFRAVVPTPSAAAGDMRLDVEILRLQQEFGDTPSRVRLTLRATVIDNATRRVLAWREIDQTEAAPSEDTYGGVVATHRALRVALNEVARLCTEAATTWRPAQPPGSTRAEATPPPR